MHLSEAERQQPPLQNKRVTNVQTRNVQQIYLAKPTYIHALTSHLLVKQLGEKKEQIHFIIGRSVSIHTLDSPRDHNLTWLRFKK